MRIILIVIAISLLTVAGICFGNASKLHISSQPKAHPCCPGSCCPDPMGLPARMDKNHTGQFEIK